MEEAVDIRKAYEESASQAANLCKPKKASKKA